MKKVVSLLVALATAFGVSATAFAAQDDILTPGARTTPYASGDITGNNAGTGAGTITGRAGVTGANDYGTGTGTGTGTGITGFNAGTDYGTGTGTTGFNATTDYGTGTGAGVGTRSGVTVVNDSFDNNGIGTDFGAPTAASMRSIDPTYGTSLDAYAIGHVVIVEDKAVADNPRIVQDESRLEPGRDFKFRLNVVIADATAESGKAMIPITESMLGGGKFRIRGKGTTSGLEKVEIKKRGTGAATYYRLELTTKETWGTKTNDVDYTISFTSTTATTHPFAEASTTAFQVGYDSIPDSDVDDYEEDDTLTISQDTPVILKEQFVDLAKNANYKAIPLEDENNAWAFTGRVSGMASSNFKYTRDVIPEIVTTLEEQDFEFLTFGGGITFPTNGEMRIDVSDFSTEFGRIYTYLYRNGKLTPITTTYDAGADELVFRTNYLGSFVMTDRQITDENILDNNIDNNNNEEEQPSEVIPTPDNPGTGASRGLNLAMALGLASLAAIGITRKK